VSPRPSAVPSEDAVDDLASAARRSATEWSGRGKSRRLLPFARDGSSGLAAPAAASVARTHSQSDGLRPLAAGRPYFGSTRAAQARRTSQR
jgi:hypothetical protein